MLAKSCLFPAAVLAAIAPAAAQENAEPIVVLGQALPPPPGTPAYGSVTIDRDRLRNSASGMIETALGDIAGLQQFRRSDSRSANPSAQGVTMRALGGNASSRTLVVLDGVPVADPFFGYIPFTALVPERLSLVRVTRGGGTGAFGAGAVAGTVELASATRADLPLLEASGFYGSRDATSLSASVSPDLGAGFVTISGRWDRGDGFWTTPTDQRTAASVPARYENWSTGLRAVAPLSGDFELQARALVFRDTRTLRFAGADSRSAGEDASIRLIGRGTWQVDALAYVQARDFSNIVISASSFRKSLDQRATPSTGIGGKVEVRPPVGDAHVLRIGADTRFASGDMYEDAYNARLATNPVTDRRHAGGDQTSTGFFIEDDWTIGALILTGGARADRWTIRNGFYRQESASTGAVTLNRFANRSGWEASGRMGALLAASNALSLRAAAYTGFRLPTLNELYRPFVVFPVTTKANAALKPERLRGVEAGLDFTPVKGVKISATAFYNRLADAIANVTIDTNSRERQNVSAILSKGFELNADARFGDFGLVASYTHVNARVKAPGQAFDTLRPAQTPRDTAALTLSYAPANGPGLSTTLRHVGKQYEDDLNSDALPAIWTVDAIAQVPLGRHFTLVARGENLFDETIYTRNAGGSIDLGMPRTLWIGVRAVL